MREKGEIFCSMYPVIPDIGESSSVCLSFDDLIEISSCLADEYNNWCEVNGKYSNMIIPWRDA